MERQAKACTTEGTIQGSKTRPVRMFRIRFWAFNREAAIKPKINLNKIAPPVKIKVFLTALR